MSENNKLYKKYGNTKYFINIFPEYTQTAVLIPNNKQKSRTVTLKGMINWVHEEKLTLIPDYYDESTNFINKVYNMNQSASGSFSTVYLKYYNIKNMNQKRKNNIIFKITNNSYGKNTPNSRGDEYNALIFHYLLQYYYQKNDSSQLRYLCNLREIGRIKEYPNTIYAIMDNCGEELVTIKDHPFIKNNTPSMGLLFILNIFKESLQALKLLHDRNYLHLDIKPQNYLITPDMKVKIIDFGFVTKCNSIVTNIFGTTRYCPPDWLINYTNSLKALTKNNIKKTVLQKHHDIFELGCMFIELIFYLINNFHLKTPITMCCPILFNKLNEENIKLNRINYTENIHKSNCQMISDLLSTGYRKNKNKIINGLGISSSITNYISNIIYGMCNPKKESRFQSVDPIIGWVDYLISNFLILNVQPKQSTTESNQTAPAKVVPLKALLNRTMSNQAAARLKAESNQAVRAQALRNQALRNQALRNQALRNQAPRNQALRNQAARAQAVPLKALLNQAFHAKAELTKQTAPIQASPTLTREQLAIQMAKEKNNDNNKAARNAALKALRARKL